MNDCGLFVIVMDGDNRIRSFNGECQRLTGFRDSEVIGKPVETVLSNPETPLGGMLRPPAGNPTREHTGLLLTCSGAGRPVVWRCKALPDAGGCGRRSVITGTCVDRRGESGAEEDAFHDLGIAHTIIDNAIDGVIVIDPTGVICAANPAVEPLFGYQASEICGHNVSMLMPEPHGSDHDGYIRRYLETGERRIIGIGREVTGRHRDGSLIELQLAIADCSSRGQRYFVGFLHDIGARKQLESEAHEHLAQLARTTRIYAMDALASSLVHEVRQPLTATHTTAQACLLLLELDADQEKAKMLKEPLLQIIQQARRANEIVDQLHYFVQQGEADEFGVHDCLTLLDNVLKLLTHKLYKAGIQTDRQYAVGQCSVSVNRILVEQVVFNLIDNAIDAMQEAPPPRILTIKTHLGTWCEIEILDTGPGISEENLERIFNPYFTTKARGTGQGLALSRSIVEKHGGQLTVGNRPSGGAAFRLVLPLDQVGRGDE